MVAVPPKLTLEQRRAALERAGVVRKKRADVKQRIKAGQVSFQDLLSIATDDEDIAGIKLLSVLESIPGIGKVKARRKLAELNISEVRRVKGLSPKQRSALLGMFEE